MTRGLPYSIAVHLVGLALVIFYGNAVQRDVIQPPRSIKVRMVQLPSQLQKTSEEAPPEPRPEPPAPRPQETVVEQPPKEVPEARPEPEPRPVEKKPEVRKDPEPAKTPPAETDAVAADSPPEAPVVSGPAVAGTDVDFPFAWYLARVQGQIARNWKPKQLGFRSRSVVSCMVHFTINKNGTVSQVTLTRSSGVGVFDREALRVVQSSRIPPLPAGFSSPSLGISMQFNLESGI